MDLDDNVVVSHRSGKGYKSISDILSFEEHSGFNNCEIKQQDSSGGDQEPNCHSNRASAKQGQPSKQHSILQAFVSNSKKVTESCLPLCYITSLFTYILKV